ncbi:S-adenosylmethionine decarboxylase [Gracilaria domingensis]|nr:S-adenosylmethionine decarboxylase [Gracilaria domingensis]
MQGRSGIQDVRKRVEKTSGSTGFHEKQVVGDKPGRLEEHVGLKMGVAADRQHGAARVLQNQVNSIARHAAQGGLGERAKSQTKRFLGVLEETGTRS